MVWPAQRRKVGESYHCCCVAGSVQDLIQVRPSSHPGTERVNVSPAQKMYTKKKKKLDSLDYHNSNKNCFNNLHTHIQKGIRVADCYSGLISWKISAEGIPSTQLQKLVSGLFLEPGSIMITPTGMNMLTDHGKSYHTF